MISVKEAEALIQAQYRDYGTELLGYEDALQRILAEDILADRDLPPGDRVTMDGIAIRFSSLENGNRAFKIQGIVAAGDVPLDLLSEDGCLEIMTGAALPESADTVVRYEDVVIKDGVATIGGASIRHGQNVHRKGRDKKEGDVVAHAGQVIGPALISMAASAGKRLLSVRKLPKVVIITTGDELVDIDDTPTHYQIRKSNSYTIKAVLQQHRLEAVMLHIPDNEQTTRVLIKDCLERYDVVLMSGGVSMGKFDYVPGVLDELGVERMFHKVQQRPGKPFWFGRRGNGPLVFAFPGNPVSTFLCLHRYFVPWLLKGSSNGKKAYAVLGADVNFVAPLQYFMQVEVSSNEMGQLVAMPVEGNGSGDFANLLDSNAFMELPKEKENFKQGEVYRIWPFKLIV